jgi:hypothetical protein
MHALLRAVCLLAFTTPASAEGRVAAMESNHYICNNPS